MGKTVALVLVLVFLTASCTVIAEPAFSDETTENSWTTLAPMPTARGGLDAAVADGKIYAIGGGVGASNKNEEYDPTTNTWAIKAAIPTGRSN